MRKLLLVALSLPLVATACSSVRSRLPAVRELYREASLRETRNPVVVIHGILGARLEERATRRSVWGAFTDDYADPETPDGARLIALPLRIPASALAYDPEQECVIATEPLGQLRLSLLFQVINVEVYASILRTLGIGGYRDRVLIDPQTPAYTDDHFTCSTFFYDWRRDNVENAIRFGAFLRNKRQEIDGSARRKIESLRDAGDPASRREADEIEAWLAHGYKFDVVAHSMGGLIAHYYLRFGEQDLPADGSIPPVTWAGSAEIDRVIQVGTPNFGAAEAISELHAGFQPAFFLPCFHPAILGTMPSIYQLMPRTRHGVLLDEDGAVADADLYDPALWRDNGWGLAAADADEVLGWLLPDVPDPAARRRQALEYQAWCLARARRFHAALDAPPATPTTSRIYLFAADTEPTVARAVLVRRDGRLVPTFDRPLSFLPGDVTVPRYSAVADDRTGSAYRPWLSSPIPWAGVTFLADDHVGLTANAHFVNNMLFILLETPPPSR